MSKVFYIEDENGEFYSEDRKKRYIRLQGQALKQYLISPEGKQKRFYIEDDIGIEIPKEKQKTFRSYERRKQYVAEMQENFPYYCISLYSDIIGAELSGEEVIADEAINVQNTVINAIQTEQLHIALHSLSEDERYLIEALYFIEPPMPQKDIAKKLNISQQAVSKRISAVLQKLKSLLEK